MITLSRKRLFIISGKSFLLCVVLVSIKPTSSISKSQNSINLKSGKTKNLEVKGCHDACIALRLPVVVEAVTAIVLADLMLAGQKISKVLIERSSS